jgi:CRISPR/Cas system CMR-associated protein Cmr3 (group 5 of RAMP superfamily)
MHRDIVVSVPKDAVNLGYSPICEVQGLYIPGRVFSVQAHPEFSGFIMTSILEARRAQAIFNDDVYQSGLSRADNDHDGVLVSMVIWRFLLNRNL